MISSNSISFWTLARIEQADHSRNSNSLLIFYEALIDSSLTSPLARHLHPQLERSSRTGKSQLLAMLWHSERIKLSSEIKFGKERLENNYIK